MKINALAFMTICLMSLTSADEIETVKQVKAVVIPQPIAVEQVSPKEVVTQVTAVGAGVTDLVKQVKRLETKLNLVLERLIARKREISSELDGFEGGVDSVLNLLSPEMTVIEESKPGKKTTLITQEDDSDDDAEDEEEPAPKKTIIISGDRKRRQGGPKRRKREISDPEPAENIKLPARNPKALKSGLHAHERSSSISSPTIHSRRKRDSIRRKRFSGYGGNKKGVEARYRLNLDSSQPVLIEETGPGWPVRARRRAGGASVEVIAHLPAAGKDLENLMLERAQREAIHKPLHGRGGRKRTDDEDPNSELDVGKRDTTIVEETSDIDGPGNFAEETVSEEKVISDEDGSETKIIEKQSEQDTDENVKEEIIEETDTTDNAGTKTSIVEEVDNVEDVDGSEEEVVIEEEEDDDDDDDDDDDRPRLDSALSEDGGDDALDEDTNGPVMADGSPV